MSLFTIFFLYFVALVHATPLVKRIVVSPPITSPTASTVWNVGDKVLVTWNTSDIPEPKNFTGQLVLGFQENDSENLMLDNPLARGFQLIDGQVQITVPDVPPKSDYIVVLFGDSGNASPEFTIQGGSGSSSSASASSSSASVTSSSIPSPTSAQSPSPISSSTSIEVPTTSAVPSAPSTISAAPSSSASSSASLSVTTSITTVFSSPVSSITTASVSSSAASSFSSSAVGTSLPAQGNVGSNGAVSRHLSQLMLPSFVGFAVAVVFLI